MRGRSRPTATSPVNAFARARVSDEVAHIRVRQAKGRDALNGGAIFGRRLKGGHAAALGLFVDAAFFVDAALLVGVSPYCRLQAENSTIFRVGHGGAAH
jgi:hypothetical protein